MVARAFLISLLHPDYVHADTFVWQFIGRYKTHARTLRHFESKTRLQAQEWEKLRHAEFMNPIGRTS